MPAPITPKIDLFTTNDSLDIWLGMIAKIRNTNELNLISHFNGMYLFSVENKEGKIIGYWKVYEKVKL